MPCLWRVIKRRRTVLHGNLNIAKLLITIEKRNKQVEEQQ